MQVKTLAAFHCLVIYLCLLSHLNPPSLYCGVPLICRLYFYHGVGYLWQIFSLADTFHEIFIKSCTNLLALYCQKTLVHEGFYNFRRCLNIFCRTCLPTYHSRKAEEMQVLFPVLDPFYFSYFLMVVVIALFD